MKKKMLRALSARSILLSYKLKEADA